ncbi:(2Fe-2S)-binding protein [Agrobacterium vitis]|uniref:(2Fe-2S)-binding protein n=1 Tax=Agrobacterium vitis TaxID=373 RepID=UPI001573EDB2|nr:(2Fe-2S)-binding protein [Agrobacterium vitis]NSZ19905.1 (2Fe-2S)-binding protein [Agrobacterium vitis]QZO07598.1 (2Fe-2S)-binding protein [Agrobacterium vitis]UJL90792.1 (2Fe-2S)-binding protein [Agrobacterium vitis]
MTNTLNLTVNGILYPIANPQDRTLLDILRSEFGLKGAKYGCGKAQCGACTVLIEGLPARSCVLRAKCAVGREITTLEGLADPLSGALSPVQQAFLECEGAQCGYCLNGMVMSATALLHSNPSPTRDDIRNALRHNLCRCGTHLEIIASVERAAVLMWETRHD